MSKTFMYVGLVMGSFFVLAGILLALKPELANLGPNFAPYSNWIAISVILYGLFRIYRSYMALKDAKNNE